MFASQKNKKKNTFYNYKIKEKACNNYTYFIKDTFILYNRFLNYYKVLNIILLLTIIYRYKMYYIFDVIFVVVLYKDIFSPIISNLKN